MSVSDLLSKSLYEVGHPQHLVPLIIDPQANALVGGPKAEIDIEVSCHPQELFGSHDSDLNKDSQNQSPTLEQLVQSGPETLEDREKWRLLTRELVQK